MNTGGGLDAIRRSGSFNLSGQTGVHLWRRQDIIHLTKKRSTFSPLHNSIKGHERINNVVAGYEKSMSGRSRRQVHSDITASNRKAGVIGIASGICLLIAGANGASFWIMLSAALETVLPNNEFGQTVLMILLVLTVISALGGILVLLGSVLIIESSVGLGKVLINLGAGTGLIGLIIIIVLALWQGGLVAFLAVMLGLLTFQGLGILLSIVASFMAATPD
jgi:hypothetical protein